jgi:hypothetical protein
VLIRGLEFPDQLGVSSEGEIGFHPCGEGVEPLFLQPGDLGLGERLVDELGQRWPAPQRKRLSQLLRSHLGCGRQRLSAIPG